MAQVKFLKNPPRLFALFFSILPIIILIFLVHKYAVDFPTVDEWYLLEFIEKYHEGDLTIFDFWRPYDGHRAFFSAVVFFFFTMATQFNVIYEIYFAIFLAVLNFLVILRHISLHSVELHIEKYYRWLWIALSIFIFSLVQAESWMWGFLMHIFLNMLSVLCGAFIFSNFNLNKSTFTGLALCGVVATFTRGNGYAYWVCIFCFLILFKFLYKKIHAGYIISWLAVSLAVLLGYLYDYDYQQVSIVAATPADIMRDPLKFCHFIIKFIGSPVAFYNENIFFNSQSIFSPGIFWTRLNHAHINAWGGMGVILYIIFLATLFFQKSSANAKARSFFYIIGLYVIISAFITSIGRAGFGPDTATASRYTSITIYFWISIFFLLMAHIGGIHRISAGSGWLYSMNRTGCMAIFAAMCLSSYNSAKAFPLERKEHLLFYTELPRGICLDNEKDFFRLVYPRYMRFIHTAQILKQSIFRDMDKSPVSALFHEKLNISGNWSTLVQLLPARDFNVSASLTSRGGTNERTGSVKSDPIMIKSLSSPVINLKIVHGGNTKRQKIGIRINSASPVELVADLKNKSDVWHENMFDLSKYPDDAFIFFAEDNGAGEDEWLGFLIPIIYYKH